jgi:hypothetical protein
LITRERRKRKKDERCVGRGNDKYPNAGPSILEAANKKQNGVNLEDKYQKT